MTIKTHSTQRIDPRHLRAVHAIVEHGSFNRAASALGLSQPALSKSVVLLEHALGVRLFDRDRRGARLTDAGRIIARCAQNSDEILRQACDEISGMADGLTGPLRIGATPSLLLGLLPQAIASLSAKHASVRISLIEGYDASLQSALHSGEIEMLVGQVESLVPISRDFVERRLLLDDFLVALPHGHALYGQEKVCLQEIAEDAWVLPTVGSSFFDRLQSLFSASGTPWPRNFIATNSVNLQERFVEQTGRTCIVTATQLLGRNPAFHLARLDGAPPRAIGARYRRNLVLSPMASDFLECLADAARLLRKHSPLMA
ncbi:LysR substrate-binding domain-containing protein [Sphingobium bisphenolivorans]|uniref:LysR family transcriptional regulator n=1 Tax=Sphingobium bisphenolivorans TaxID=1335760 RepID=UPI000399F3BE|nr:LysR substrate-binding domain-containing protein [Sphingobium bisphenolivorans]